MARTGKLGRFIPPTELYTKSTTNLCDLGAQVQLDDGRRFVYAKAGAALTNGQVVMGPATTTANHLNCVLAGVWVTPSSVIGQTPTSTTGAIPKGTSIRALSVTLGATAAAANLYAGGYIVVNAGTGLGLVAKIARHDAIASAGTGWIYLEEPLVVDGGATNTLDTSDSKITFVKNPYNGVLVGTATPNMVVGVAQQVMASGDYGWFQCGGPCAVVTSGTIVIGNNVATAAAGAVTPLTTNATAVVVGQVIQVRATAEASLINLAIPNF